MSPRKIALLPILILLGFTMLSAQQPTVKKMPARPTSAASGHDMFVAYCASCHGRDAKGNGPAASALKTRPPDLGRLLPRQVLSASEVERVLAQPNTRNVLGLRDRAILEVLYSTGLRRLELRNLVISDLHLDRQIVFVREGKGRKDRYVPIGNRAVYWVRRYLKGARVLLTADPENTVVFVTAQGRRFSRDHLTWLVRKHVSNAQLGKDGACHLFRHTMATLMHENGADIRTHFIL